MKQLILILIVFALAAAGAYWLLTHKPEIKKHTKKINIPIVSVAPIKKQDYPIVVHSSGIVEARTQTNLVAEVAGKITRIGKAFQEGNYIKKNNLLLKISETDYRNNIDIAHAEIARQQLALEEQMAQRELAKQDWDLFGEKRKKPSKLAMRSPHITSAKATLLAAKIRMDQAKTQLSRTKVIAPYDGRVLERSVDIGQYVTPGTILGKIFATDYIEVRLPLSLKEYELLDIPEHYQNENMPKLDSLPTVTFYTNKTQRKNHQWQGRVVRTSASVDSNTRQLSVIARISKPFSRTKSDSPLIILGQFLQADIMGKKLSNVVVVPSAAVRQQKEIFLFIKDEMSTDTIHDITHNTTHDNTQTDKKAKKQKQEMPGAEQDRILGTIKIQPVNVIHTDNNNIVIAVNELPENSLIILTPPPLVTDRMKVKIIPQKSVHRTMLIDQPAIDNNMDKKAH